MSYNCLFKILRILNNAKKAWNTLKMHTLVLKMIVLRKMYFAYFMLYFLLLFNFLRNIKVHFMANMSQYMDICKNLTQNKNSYFCSFQYPQFPYFLPFINIFIKLFFINLYKTFKNFMSSGILFFQTLLHTCI